MARMKEKAMLALNLPQVSPRGETSPQYQTDPQLSPTNYAKKVSIDPSSEKSLTRRRHQDKARSEQTYVDENAKGHEPADGDEKVKRPVDEARREGYEP